MVQSDIAENHPFPCPNLMSEGFGKGLKKLFWYAWLHPEWLDLTPIDQQILNGSSEGEKPASDRPWDRQNSKVSAIQQKVAKKAVNPRDKGIVIEVHLNDRGRTNPLE